MGISPSSTAEPLVLPQRRRRVFIVASQTRDPRDVLLAQGGGTEKWPAVDMARPIGFYWTEGRTGHGLTGDAVPPLKAGSTLAIPCPPAVLLPSGRVVTPTIGAVEQFQGFPRGLDFDPAYRVGRSAEVATCRERGVGTGRRMDRTSTRSTWFLRASGG